MMRLLTLVVAALLLAACTLSPERKLAADAVVERYAGSVELPWEGSELIADSPLAGLGEDNGRQHVLLVEQGADALGLRIHLIRSARSSIELMNYIFYDDESGELLLTELIDAARRGVRVRVLVDSLFSLDNHRLLAAIELLDVDIQVRLYNPLFDRATLGNGAFIGAILCCLGELNHRLHHKLLSVDGRHGLVGGRNTADRYFDLDTRMNFLDMEALVSGSAVRDMVADFDRFWAHGLSRPARHTREVARHLFDDPPGRVELDADNRARHGIFLAENQPWLQRLIDRAGFEVEAVHYFADAPGRAGSGQTADGTVRLHELMRQAERSILIQTPYFVLSPEFRQVLDSLDDAITVRVSTNSLAATDAWPVYAISRRQRFDMVERLGIELYEVMPYPRDLALFNRRYWRLVQDRASGFVSPMRVDPPPAVMQMPGPRISVHGKIMVIDDRISVITSHNFDPRSERFNTENGVVIEGEDLAAALSRYIERIAAPGNSWQVRTRNLGRPIVSGFNRTMSQASRSLPTLDLWPWYQTRNYQQVECQADRPADDSSCEQDWVDQGLAPQVVSPRRILSAGLVSRMFGFLWPIM